MSVFPAALRRTRIVSLALLGLAVAAPVSNMAAQERGRRDTSWRFDDLHELVRQRVDDAMRRADDAIRRSEDAMRRSEDAMRRSEFDRAWDARRFGDEFRLRFDGREFLTEEFAERIRETARRAAEMSVEHLDRLQWNDFGRLDRLDRLDRLERLDRLDGLDRIEVRDRFRDMEVIDARRIGDEVRRSVDEAMRRSDDAMRRSEDAMRRSEEARERAREAMDREWRRRDR